MEIVDRKSPNFADRPRAAQIELIVLHYTAMADCNAAAERLCDETAEVSAHYLIGKDGTLIRLVDEEKRAWHAGLGSWAGRGDVNSRSIGIELDNDGATSFEPELMSTLQVLLRDLLDRHQLHPKSVIGHSDMAPDRKSDPGPLFPWRALAAQRLSIWPDPSQQGDFMTNARAFGYPVELGETSVLSAFRQRFRPGASGPLNVADEAMMSGLARQFPA